MGTHISPNRRGVLGHVTPVDATGLSHGLSSAKLREYFNQVLSQLLYVTGHGMDIRNDVWSSCVLGVVWQ